MFKSPDRSGSDADRLLLDGLRDLARSRLARAVAMVLVALLVGTALYVSWLFQQTLSSECEDVSRYSPSMEQIIDVRERLAEYQSDPRPGAEVILSAEEVTYTVGDRPELQMLVSLAGDQMTAQIAIPREDGCYNIDFRGLVRIDDGVAVLQPITLVVGSVDLTWITADRGWRLESENMPDERSARLLANTKRLRIVDGQAHIQLANRWDLW